MLLGQARNAGPQAADAAHDEVDLDAGLARLVELVDDLRVDQRVHLHPDRRRPTGLGVRDLLVDVAQTMRSRMPCGLAAITSSSDGSP